MGSKQDLESGGEILKFLGSLVRQGAAGPEPCSQMGVWHQIPLLQEGKTLSSG